MRQRLSDVWPAFKNVAIVFSFVVNLVLVIVLLLAIGPIFQAKREVVQPLLVDLDQAFQGLGETQINTTVQVDQEIPIRFDLPLDQQLALDFNLPIEQDTVVLLTSSVPLENLPARFNLPGGGGVINGSVSLSLPAGMRLPIRLSMVVPVQTTIPVQMMVPVDQMVAIQMTIPVSMELGEAGLDPAVQDLRDVFAPIRITLEDLPDSVDEVIR